MFKINGATNTLRTPLRPEIGVCEPSVQLWEVVQLEGYRTVRRNWVITIGLKKLSSIRNWDFGDFRYDLCIN